MTVSTAEQQKQIKQAEEMLAGGPEQLGFAKGLYFGRFISDWIMPYPRIIPGRKPEVDQAVDDVRRFCNEKIDASAIDRMADIPRSVINGLAELGVLGMTAPKEVGGRGFGQGDYCRIMEVLGGHCSSTSIFVNAHHSIGIRALLLFGTPEQQRRWLPDLVSGKSIAAFALTEPNAGSDAANVQTEAKPTDDGAYYILNGEKRYITNGGIAQVLTVMARTPVKGSSDTKVTAFLVTPDMPGFEVVEARAEKLGIKGTATGKLAFHDMRVPAANILGPLGKGLRVALTVLDFGRTTFGACCTGAAKTCLRLAVEHANSRKQFGRTLGEFDLVKKKIGQMAAWVYAMEAMTHVTASMIDRGLEDYMLETAILKVYTTEALWTIINDAFQIHGGAAYFTDRPLERMLRDGRINQIGEGANDVLRSFIALVGMRGPGEQMMEVATRLKRPWAAGGALWNFAKHEAGLMFRAPAIPVTSAALVPLAQRLATLIRKFALAAQQTMIRAGKIERLVERQLDHERVAEAAMELFASCCTLSRLDAEMAADAGPSFASQHKAARYFLNYSIRRAERFLSELGSNNDDGLLLDAAAAALKA